MRFFGGGLYAITLIEFTMLFLKITRRHAVFFTLFRLLQTGVFGIMTASLVMEYGRVVRPFNILGTVGGLAAVLAGFVFLVRGSRSARYYLLVIGIGGIWVILLPLVRVGVLPGIPLTERVFEMSMLSLSFFWAVAMMKRVALLRQEREQTFDALQESKQQLQDIAENIPGMVYQFRVRQDGSTYFSYVSPRGSDLFGLPEDFQSEEWELGALGLRLPPDDREAFFASITQAIVTCAGWNYEGRILMDHGSVKWFQGTSSPTQIGDELVFNGILLADPVARTPLRLRRN